MSEYSINVGPLTSFNSLVYYLGPQLSNIRNEYIQGKTPKVKFNFCDLKPNSISLPALTALLANAKKLSDFIGNPIPVQMKWDPIVNAFLHKTHFFAVGNQLRIFSFPAELLGSFGNADQTPYLRIMYFGDIKPIVSTDSYEIGLEKAKHKIKILGNFKVRTSNIFERFEPEFETTVINTTLELIVNSLMHAQDYAFVAMQRTAHRITVTVCDAGIGFPKSLNKSNPFKHFENITHAQALFIGSLIQKEEHGLRLAINEVLGYESNDLDKVNIGWVTISSFDTEIRWQKLNWERAINYANKVDLRTTLPDLNLVMDEPISGYVNKDRIEEGYWKRYENSLVGTRITFEIRF